MSATGHLEGLAAAINQRRPLVVLMGQDAWRSNERPDPILVAALKRSRRHTEEAARRGLPSLLTADPLPDDFYQWLADAYSNQVEAEWLEPIASLPLNAFFTTSVDPALSRALRIGGRDVESVLSKSDTPSAPRHRRNLHLTYLFGRAGESNPSEAPPKSNQELRRRTALHAMPLLSRLVETTTSLGILAIDGFVCGRDWLPAEALYGVLSAFKPGQVFWFGWDRADAGQDAALLEELAGPHGPVTFIPQRFSAALRQLSLSNRIEPLDLRTLAADNAITIGAQTLEVPAATRFKTSTAATIIDDSWLAPPSPLGDEALYEEFRRFHGYVEDARRLVDGICRGFAIQRTFEVEFQSRVARALADVGRHHEPVLIHGQSGTGKSLALARLAFKVRSERRYPVLLATRVSRMPAVDELDEFCLRAEDVGAEATLVICDVNAPVSRYRELLRGFQSRGRRAVVVGSAYRLVDEANGSSAARGLLEAPAALDEAELETLTRMLKEWTGVTHQSTTSTDVLAAVYRLLPDVRPRLAAGLAREARAVEDDLRSRGATKRRAPPTSHSALGQALLAARLIDPRALLEDKIEAFMGTMSDSASKAIDYVMMPGKLDCPVPVNLLMRAVGGSESLVDISSLFSGVDLFRWSSNDDDDVFVHPRLRLEAELISARRLGTAQAEVAIAIELLGSANPSSHGSCERRFVLDLVHKLGPDGPFGRRYAPHDLEIARALTDVRERRGVTDPSLMLQEATLRRSALRDASTARGADPAMVLEEARQVIDLALDEFCGGAGRGLRRMCANLKVERAAIYGFRAVQQLKSGASEDDVWQFYEAARDSTRSAIYAADTYHAIDVSLWVPDDLLKGGMWTAERRAELIADVWDGLERVDVGQLELDQRERFEERRLKVAQTLDDNTLEKAALDALQKMGSRAGVFLQARALGGPLWGRGAASADELERARHVVAFMDQHRSEAQDDARCLRYLLRARWIEATRTYLFGEERSPLPGKEDELRGILEVLESLGGLEGALGDPRSEYLRAVLLWRLQREHAGREIWTALSQDTAFSDPRRIVRHHVWTDSEGRPRSFHGRIIRDDPGRGRARVQVEEIRQEIELLQRDFPQLELRRGVDVSGGFYIAFNFIGPVAEPLGRRGASR